MTTSLTPTYTSSVTGQSRQQSLVRSPSLIGKDISHLAPPSAGDWRVFQAPGYVFSFTHTTYTSLRPFCRCSDRLLRIVKSHLSHSRPVWRIYSLVAGCFSPTSVRNHAVFNKYSPTSGAGRVSFMHLRSLMGTYAPPPPATHALTPLFKGVSARGEENND